MPEGYSSAADVPLEELVGDEWVRFPLLASDDLAVLGRKIQKDRAAKAMKDLPATATAEREQVRQWYEDNEASIEDLSRYVWTVDGSVAALDRSLEAAGETPERRKAVIAKLKRTRGLQGVAVLATEVSTLGPGRERDDRGRRKEKNDRGGATAGAAPPSEKTEPTTDSSGSPSGQSPAATRAA